MKLQVTIEIKIDSSRDADPIINTIRDLGQNVNILTTHLTDDWGNTVATDGTIEEEDDISEYEDYAQCHPWNKV
jgi:hypothetical protein